MVNGTHALVEKISVLFLRCWSLVDKIRYTGPVYIKRWGRKILINYSCNKYIMICTWLIYMPKYFMHYLYTFLTFQLTIKICYFIRTLWVKNPLSK